MSDSPAIFWYETTVAKKRRLCIDEVKLLDFLQKNGFGRWQRYKKKGTFETCIARKINGSICPVSTLEVRDFVFDYVDSLENRFAFAFEKSDLKNVIIKSPALFSKSRLNWLKPLQGESHA